MPPILSLNSSNRRITNVRHWICNWTLASMSTIGISLTSNLRWESNRSKWCENSSNVRRPSTGWRSNRCSRVRRSRKCRFQSVYHFPSPPTRSWRIKWTSWRTRCLTWCTLKAAWGWNANNYRNTTVFWSRRRTSSKLERTRRSLPIRAMCRGCSSSTFRWAMSWPCSVKRLRWFIRSYGRCVRGFKHVRLERKRWSETTNLRSNRCNIEWKSWRHNLFN